MSSELPYSLCYTFWFSICLFWCTNINCMDKFYDVFVFEQCYLIKLYFEFTLKVFHSTVIMGVYK